MKINIGAEFGYVIIVIACSYKNAKEFNASKEHIKIPSRI